MEEEAAFVYERLSPLIGDDERPASAAPEAEDEALLVTGFDAVNPPEDFLAVNADNAAAAAAADVLVLPWDEPGGEGEYISLGTDEEEQDKDVSPVLANVDPELFSANQALPWVRPGNLKGNTFRSPLLQLHQEILDFCKFISPTQEEHRERLLAVERVTDCIKALWPHSKVEIFGSFATGLYLPTSDVDMVVMNSGCLAAQNGLKALAKMLRKRTLAKKLLVIAKARVPIVKFVEAGSGVSFDISFDLENGPEAAKFIKAAISTLPPLRPLCLVLKIFLQQRELNEVYTGGVGSYALLVMLMVHLQLHSSRQTYGSLEKNLGSLLMDFLELYGRGLNMKDVGISCSNGGRFFLKSSRGFYDRKRPFLLSVEDPQAPENDIGKNSYNIPKVRSAFMLAHRLLTTADEAVGNVGLLGRVVRYDNKLLSRKNVPEDGHVPTYFFNDGMSESDTQEQKAEKKQKKKRPPWPVQNDVPPKKRKRKEVSAMEPNPKKRKSSKGRSSKQPQPQPQPEDEHLRRRKNRSRNYTDHCDNDEIEKVRPAKRVAGSSSTHRHIRYH